jgi:hypothetical protein
VVFGVGLSYSLEWIDNVYTRDTDKEWDLIHRPQVNVSAAWPATQDSLLSVGLGIGYSKYTRNGELDRFYLSPNSELAWDIPYRDFVFTLYDRFSYSQEVLSVGALSGAAEFPRFDNTVGARATWRPEAWILQAGYGHQNYFTDSGDYDYLDRASEQFFGRVAYQFAPSAQGGIEAGTGFTSYDRAVQSDNASFSVGPFVDWQVTEALDVGVRGGWVYYDFEGSPTTGPASSLSSYYAGVTARHQMTRYISQALSLNRSVSQGYNQGSQYNEQFHGSYVLTWQFHRWASLSGDVFYSRGTEPQAGRELTYDHFGFGSMLSYQLTKRLSSQLSYRFTVRDSDELHGDYQVNQVVFSVSYYF